jgi:hypothetical protein
MELFPCGVRQSEHNNSRRVHVESMDYQIVNVKPLVGTQYGLDWQHWDSDADLEHS